MGDSEFHRLGKLRQHSQDTVLLAQGQPIELLGLVISGSAVARVFTAQGAMVWLDEFQPGDWIGSETLSSGALSAYEVTAQSDVEILYVSQSDITRVLAGNAQLLGAFSSKNLAVLQRRTEHLIAAKTLSATGRICAELKRRARPIGIERGHFIIRPTPIFSDVAFRAATTRESVSRLVSTLSRHGIIQRKTGALVIPDMTIFETKLK